VNGSLGERPVASARMRREATAAASTASSPGVRSCMQAQRPRDTVSELGVRRLLHARGLCYRVDQPPILGLPGRADIELGPARLAVFVDGCYLHGCPEHGTAPRANSDFWQAKFEANRRGDADTDTRLVEAGWQVLRVWEREDASSAAERVQPTVLGRRRGLAAADGGAA